MRPMRRMRRVHQGLTALLAVADALAMAALALLVLVVAGAILGRLAFDLSRGGVNLLLPGAIELSRYALMLCVLAALPRAVATGLIRVELVLDALPARMAAALGAIWMIVAAGIGSLAATSLAGTALTQAERGDLTQDLGMPLWPFTAFAAGALALVAVIALVRAAGLDLARGPVGPDEER
ncbi:MAG: TRAP transporter small permease [Pikeienuella sp.]